jgi:hypothetical protein
MPHFFEPIWDGRGCCTCPIKKRVIMFYKIVSSDNINRLVQLVTDLLHQGWETAGRIVFKGQNYPRQ